MRRVILLWSASTVLMLGLFLPLWAQEIPLTSDNADHGDPQWSPDGNWIVYDKYDGIGWLKIYKILSAGGAEILVTDSSSSGYWPCPQWSPDGNWIAYHRQDEAGLYQIYKVSSSGGTGIPLTGTDAGMPQWSPDGNWIVYAKWDSTDYGQIYKVPSTGGTEIALTSDNYDHNYPQWSPDGNWIVYQKTTDTIYWNCQIYKISSSGGAEIALTSNNYGNEYPQWSPDGNWIAYDRYDSTGSYQICKISSSGGTEIPLTNGDVWVPQWSLDGNWIVYMSLVDSYVQIYRISSSGGTEIPLTSDNYDHEYPQWSPDGNWIVYQKYDATNYWQIYKVPSGVGIEEDFNSQLTISNYQLSVYPNPFTKTTVIRFQVPGVKEETNTYHLTPASLNIYDVSGRLVKSFSLFTPHSSLISSVSWYGKDNSGNELQGGVYFIKLTSGNFISVKKVILVR